MYSKLKALNTLSLPLIYFRVQHQVTGVINTMKDNITKVLERGDKLEDLEEKSGILFIEKNYLANYF